MAKDDTPVNLTVSQAVTTSSIGHNETGEGGTITALTIAGLVVVIIIILLVCSALRKRRGEQETLNTGIMGTGAQAYIYHASRESDDDTPV